MISCNLYSFISSSGRMCTEHMSIGLCKVAFTAIVCRSVFKCS